ncbi:MAG: phosphopantetheine adenylyltransferase [Candidatus Hepatoplasma scabrum]|nr:MAG: phosphopantetheine adenylyltransferase [Candidatus Hepatoplasma sp.]
MEKTNNEIKKEEIAIFPASFNPIHIGHIELIKMSATIYKTLYVFVADNESKNYQVKLEDRFKIVNKAISFLNMSNIIVIKQNNLQTTGSFTKDKKIDVVIRGNREIKLSSYESILADKYLEDNENLKFHFFSFEDEQTSSTKIRELIANDQSISGLVPKIVEKDIIKLWKNAER